MNLRQSMKFRVIKNDIKVVRCLESAHACVRTQVVAGAICMSRMQFRCDIIAAYGWSPFVELDSWVLADSTQLIRVMARDGAC